MVRKSTHKCIGTYVKLTKKLEFVLRHIIQTGLENQTSRTRQHSMLVIPAVIAGGFVLAIICLYYASRRRLLRIPKASLARLSTAWHALTPHVKLKIVVGFYVLATRVDSVYEIEMPYQVKRMLDFFSVAVSLGIGGLSTPLDCIGWSGYRARLLFYISFIVHL